MSASGTDVVFRRRVERLIGVLAPLLDLLLAVGDRVSRVLDPDDPDYVAPRVPRHGESAPRGLRSPRVPSSPGAERDSSR